MGFFARLFVTPAPDMDDYERRQNHPSISDPVYSSDSAEWLAAHETRDATTPVALHPASHRAA